MIQRYINTSLYSVDNFFQQDRWFYRLKINNYQIVSILWNLGLMFVPWLSVKLLAIWWHKTHFHKIGHKLVALALFLIWLLFIPNTAYVISEVRHLIDYCPRDSEFQVCEKNAWMSIFFFTYSLIGWIFFVYLTTQMRNLIELIWSKMIGYLFVLILMPVMALGFLLGLLNRWNSWEFFIYPKQFFQTLPVYWQDEVYFTNWLIFTIFLYILYFGGQWLFKDRIKYL